MKKRILSLAILDSLSVGAYAQGNTIFSRIKHKVTAVVDSGCDLTVENINYSILTMPLSDNTAQENMNIKCSKGQLSIAIKLNTNENYRFEQYHYGYGPECIYIILLMSLWEEFLVVMGKYAQHVAYSSQTVAVL